MALQPEQAPLLLYYKRAGILSYFQELLIPLMALEELMGELVQIHYTKVWKIIMRCYMPAIVGRACGTCCSSVSVQVYLWQTPSIASLRLKCREGTYTFELCWDLNPGRKWFKNLGLELELGLSVRVLPHTWGPEFDSLEHTYTHENICKYRLSFICCNRSIHLPWV